MSEPVVIDTNIWLDWLVFGDPGVIRLRAAVAAGRLRVMATPVMRAELLAVLQRPMIQARHGDALACLAGFDAVAAIHPPAPACGLRCTDPDDQMFIDLACHLRAGWLISKDRALLRLGRQARARHGLRVLTPLQFDAAYNQPPCALPEPP